MVLFFFHGLQPKLFTPDRFYKVYVTGDSLYAARVAGQFFDWRSAAVQLLIFAPFAYWSIRGRRRREAMCDAMINQPRQLLAKDRNNFEIPRRRVSNIRTSGRGRMWTAMYGGGTLTIDVHGGASLDLIIFGPNTSELIAERLHRAGYPDATSTPNIASSADDDNPYRSPVGSY